MKQEIITSLLADTFKQIYTPKPKNTKVWFTNSALKKMEEWGLSEAKVKDAVLHGEYVIGKDDMISRKYNGYEIGIYFFIAPDTGQTVISSIWKKPRR